jgi:hypothetical protein
MPKIASQPRPEARRLLAHPTDDATTEIHRLGGRKRRCQRHPSRLTRGVLYEFCRATASVLCPRPSPPASASRTDAFPIGRRASGDHNGHGGQAHDPAAGVAASPRPEGSEPFPGRMSGPLPQCSDELDQSTLGPTTSRDGKMSYSSRGPGDGRQRYSCSARAAIPDQRVRTAEAV